VKVASEFDAAHSSEPGQPAAHGNEHAEAEYVARDRDFQRDRVAPEVAGHGR